MGSPSREVRNLSEPTRTFRQMLCQACHRVTTRRVLCERCRFELSPAPERLLPGGVRVIAAFEHSGPARVLVHHFKYRGVTDYAELVSAVVGPRIPRLPLVPIPRARSRWARYGVDPAEVLAERLARRVGVPVQRLFRPPLHTARRAGGDHDRPVVSLLVRKRKLENVVLVDDVMTTGATLEAAVSAIGTRQVRAAVVANAVPGVSSPRPRDSRVASGRASRIED